MSVTLWLDTAREQTVELGPTFPCYAAFTEMSRAAGADYLRSWPALFAVIDQCESQEDADPTWFRDVQLQARQFLERYREHLGADSVWVLERLATETTT